MLRRRDTTDICQDHHELLAEYDEEGRADPVDLGRRGRPMVGGRRQVRLSIVTWTAVCWFHAMKKFMGAQSFTFQKQATGWA